MTRLLVLGATGQTGQHLVKQALEREYQVTAIVRDPSKLEVRDEKLEVVTCDIFNKSEMLPQVVKSDVIISTLGFSLLSRPVVGYAKVTEVLSECMKEAGKRRVILMHASHTVPQARDQIPSFFVRMFVKHVIGVVLDGMYDAELFLEKQEHLDYTVISPGQLLNNPVTSVNIVHSDRENYIKSEDGTSKINRADCARYMLDIIDDDASFRRRRAIAPE